MVFLAARKANKEFSTLQYFLLGDDILIGDREVAEAYLGLLDYLGVKYSKEKTYISRYMFELAKCIYYRGVEITGFPVSALVENPGSISRGLSTCLGETVKGFVPLHGYQRVLEDLDLYWARHGKVVPSRARRGQIMRAVIGSFALKAGGGEDALRAANAALLSAYP